MGMISIGGLASGLDTEAIITQMMAIEKRPRILLDNKQVLIETRQSLLREFSAKLRSLTLAASDLRSVALYAQKQAVETSDPTRITATTTSGAAVGGYQIEVSQLANAAQRSFTFTSPVADGSITIDGRAIALRAGMTAQEVATAINTNRDATVYAAATADDRIVLSNRATGDVGARYIEVTGATGVLSEQAGMERAGRDALYTIDGVAKVGRSNVITDGLAGVTLTLRGVTTVSGPITVSVGAPGADTDAIKRKVEAFVTAYNETIDLIRSKLEERSVPDRRTQQDIANGVPDSRTTLEKKAGLLFGDRQLNSLLSQMRQQVYAEMGGLPIGMNSLSDLGISTGAFSATTSRDTLAGRLTIDTDRLTKALTENPLGVRELLAGVDNVGGWARSFESVLTNATRDNGLIDTRIDGADDELRNLKNQMGMMDQRLSVRERNLRAQFAALEVAMSKSQTQGAWLSGQLAGLSN